MTGPTSQQVTLQNEQIQAYQQAQQLTAQQYANQQSIYGPMVGMFQSIFQKGPNQEGFSGAEKSQLDAQAVEGTAENYSQAAKAVGESEAAEGGGNNPLPTGAQEQTKAEIATSAAQEESGQETQIDQADYQQGYNEWLSAAGGLESIAAGENPLGYESNETSAGSAASSTAAQIASEDNSWINSAIGAAGAIGAAATKAELD